MTRRARERRGEGEREREREGSLCPWQEARQTCCCGMQAIFVGVRLVFLTGSEVACFSPTGDEGRAGGRGGAGVSVLRVAAWCLQERVHFREECAPVFADGLPIHISAITRFAMADWGRYAITAEVVRFILGGGGRGWRGGVYSGWICVCGLENVCTERGVPDVLLCVPTHVRQWRLQ